MHKLSLSKENKSSNSDIYPLEMGLIFFKNEIFMSRRVLCNPKLPPVNFSNFQAEENFSVFKIF